MPENVQRGDSSPVPALVARLIREWEKRGDPDGSIDLRDFAPPPGATWRTACLVELIQKDMEIRAQRGRLLPVEFYLDWFPELSGDHLPLELIQADYQCRELGGQRPSLSIYQQRFPAQFDRLVRALFPAPTIQRAAGTGPASGSGSRGNPLPIPASDAADSATLARHYRFLKPLGSGSCGEVWLAEAPGGVKVAIKKIFRSVSQAEGQRELQVLELIKNLHHPFLLSTQAFWQESGYLCVVMELADGSLRDRFNECKERGLSGIPVEPLAGYFRQAAEALDYLHAQRVQHRDIKPENLLLLSDFIKVADFGLARETGGHELSNATFFGGTAPYMPPEVWQCQASPHSDQYSLAVTYVEMRRGESPFRGRIKGVFHLQEAMRSHLEDDPDLAPLPEPEQAVLRKALAKKPEQRYPSCRDFTLALTESLRPKPPTTRPAPPPAEPLPAPPRRRRRLLLFSVLLGLLLCAAGGVSWFLWPPRQVPWLPDGFQQEGNERSTAPGLRRFFTTISVVKEGQTFRFRLIPGYESPGGDVSIRPFYMLEDKVTAAQFQAIAATARYQDMLKKEEKGHFNRKEDDPPSGGWKDHNDVKNWPTRPVQYVSVTEAYCFARCLECLLPRWDQWDHAGGRYDGDAGPAVWRDGDSEDDNGDVAVGLDHPVPVEKTVRDVSRHGCRNMAGNGYEWTRSVVDKLGVARFVPLPNPQNGDKVVRRGQSYTQNNQLLFHEEELPAPCRYFETREGFSFRVILEIPAEELRGK